MFKTYKWGFTEEWIFPPPLPTHRGLLPQCSYKKQGLFCVFIVYHFRHLIQAITHPHLSAIQMDHTVYSLFSLVFFFLTPYLELG